MSRWLLLGLLLVPLASTGCSMCCGPYDYEYPVFQSGRYVRMDPEYGRVGSIYSDPNGYQGISPAKTNADVPKEKTSIEGEGLDDPEFNSTDPPVFDTNGDDANPNDIDTSARVPRRSFHNRSWR